MERSFLSNFDLSVQETERILKLALDQKESRSYESVLRGKTMAMIFEKPSLRTRVTFETAIFELGGHPIYLAPGDIRLGVRETVPDVARNIERWTAGVVARVFDHGTLVELAGNSENPVINALSDLEHPCQGLADFMTMMEVKGSPRANLVYIGDGNNVANSLLLLTALFGGRMTVACPEGHEPNAEVIKRAMERAGDTGAILEISNRPLEAVRDAEFIYTDVWTSMGQEEEAEARKRVFREFQVNQELLCKAPESAKVLHCLPAHRGEEITDEVLDGERSVVLEQAENRLHTSRALLSWLYAV
jgi:ornithine carbamoyltransferase